MQRLPGRARLVDEDNDVVEYTLDNGIAKKLADYPEEASGNKMYMLLITRLPKKLCNKFYF